MVRKSIHFKEGGEGVFSAFLSNISLFYPFPPYLINVSSTKTNCLLQEGINATLMCHL